MKAIEFLRVSTKEQAEDDRAGLPRQKQANALTIKKHNLTIVKTITVIDVSGASVRLTPEIGELLSLIRSDDITGVVVADPDRLFRPDNFNDYGLLQDFIDTNTLLYLPDQILDLRTQQGYILGAINAIISGNELRQIKKRMIEAKEIKRKNGEHPNALHTLPLGVTYDRDKRRFLYTQEVHKVKHLFDLFHNKGVANYRELERLTGIHHKTAVNLLRNELFIGYRTYTHKRSDEKRTGSDGRRKDKRKVKRADDEIIRIKVIEEPLIDEDTFNRVQEIIQKKKTGYLKNMSLAGERFLYSGFLKCGVCGEALYSTSGGRNHKKDYYYCRSKNYYYVSKNGPSKCKSSYISKEMLESTITSFVAEKLIDKKYLKKLVQVAISKTDYKDKELEAESIKSELKKIEKKRSRFLDLYGDGRFTKKELDSKVTNLDDGSMVLRLRLSEIEESLRLKNEINMEENIRLLVQTLVEFKFWSPKHKREFLRSQIPEFRVTRDGISGVSINFYKKRNRRDKDSWRPPA